MLEFATSRLAMAGLSCLALLIAAGIGLVALERRIATRIEQAVHARESEIVAHETTATIEAMRRELSDRDAALTASLARLDALARSQAAITASTQQFLARSTRHDLASLAAARPHLVEKQLQSAARHTLCLLESASGADRHCAAIAANGAAPGTGSAGAPAASSR
jgi:hypothetical protein